MIPLHNTSIHLMLLTVLAVTAGRSAGASQAGPVLNTSGSTRVAAAPAAVSVPSSTNVRYMDGLLLSSGRSVAAEPVLVVPDNEMDAETASRIIEDLAVMGRIIERNAGNIIEPRDWASLSLYRRMRFDGGESGPAVLFSSSGRARPLYVAGYGVLFFIQVDFPLVAPPETTEKAPSKEEEDPVWAETRRSILEPDVRDPYGRQDAPAPTSYNRERVELLRDALTTTMKHAANIRGLEANKWLTVVVQGPSAQTEGTGAAGRAAPLRGGATTGRSALTVRAMKADVDSYAKGELSQPQFEQRVQVISY